LATLGVLSCQILELEFSYILANDGDISEIIVMDNEFSQGLIEALKKRTEKLGDALDYLDLLYFHVGNLKRKEHLFVHRCLQLAASYVKYAMVSKLDGLLPK
jgi:hypothetical protein